jgi:hypothetical protein
VPAESELYPRIQIQWSSAADPHRRRRLAQLLLTSECGPDEERAA